jgi:hypothetical protein
MDWNISVSLGSHVSKQAVYSLLNASILEISERYPVSTPAVHSHDLLGVYDYVFNNDTTSQVLVAELMQLQSIQTDIPIYFYGSNLLSYLQAFVAIPLVLFQPTSLVDYRTLNGTVPELVPNVTTTGVYSETVLRILIAKWTAVTFVAMMTSVYCQCIMCLYWATKNQLPSIASTHFPLLDFAVGLYHWNNPVAQLLLSRGEVDPGLYRQNLERQGIGVGDGQRTQSVPSQMWDGTNNGIAGNCYT